jgi:hypothetical protein
MARYQITTVVDITRTSPVKGETNQFVLNQQANFNSLVQAIGLRANITWNSDPISTIGRIPPANFDKVTYWDWSFDVEQADVFLLNNSQVGALLEDLNGVPIIAKLTNSLEIIPAVFITSGTNQNTWISIIV